MAIKLICPDAYSCVSPFNLPGSGKLNILLINITGTYLGNDSHPSPFFQSYGNFLLYPCLKKLIFDANWRWFFKRLFGTEKVILRWYISDYHIIKLKIIAEGDDTILS